MRDKTIDSIPFYEHFINIENMRKVLQADKKYFFRYYFLIFIFSSVFGFFLHIFGFSLEGLFNRIFFGVACLFGLLFLYFSYCAISIDFQYKVFKKRWMPFLFIGILALLSSAMATTAYFTTHIEFESDGESYTLYLSSQWLLIIYIALYLSYERFYSKAFLRLFALFTPSEIERNGGEP